MLYRLYSPLNFVVGVQVLLGARIALDVPAALAEVKLTNPQWLYRVGAGLVAIVLVLAVVALVLPSAAPRAMTSLAADVTGKQAAGGLAVIMAGVFMWVLISVFRKTLKGYLKICEVGYCERVRRQGRYTQKD